MDSKAVSKTIHVYHVHVYNLETDQVRQQPVCNQQR